MSVEKLPDIAKAISVLGVTAALALYLSWFVTQVVAADLRHIKGQHDTLEMYLAQVCRNTAPTPVDRISCDRIRGTMGPH
jgi:hypothetical protein